MRPSVCGSTCDHHPGHRSCRLPRRRSRRDGALLYRGARFEKHQEAVGLYQLRVGTALIDLVPVDGELGAKGGAAPGPEGRNVDHVCFRVLPWDGEAILAELAAHGIEAQIVSRYGAEGDGPSIYLTDPEGNNLELKGPPWAPVPR